MKFFVDSGPPVFCCLATLVTRNSSEDVFTPDGENRNLRQRIRGFTLIELIIVFAILGLMGSLAFSSFRLVLNSYGKSQEYLLREAYKRVLQDQMRRQIGSLFPVRPSGTFSHIQKGDIQLQFSETVSRRPLFDGRPESLTFVTLAPLMIRENPGLTIVRYGLAENERGGHYLGMMETRYIGLESFVRMVEVPEGEPLSLVENVSELRFQYYGIDMESGNYQWFDYWIGGELQTVPEAIRIEYDGNHIIVPSNTHFYDG